MKTEQINRHVLSAYSERYHAEEILSLDSFPSLSSCRYWRIETPDDTFCLRRWPRGKPTEERMQFRQAVLWHAVCEGIDFVPLPFETRSHQGFVSFDDSYWELIPWVEGTEEISSEYFIPYHFPSRSEAIEEDPAASDWNFPEPLRIQPLQLISTMVSLAQFHLAVACFPLPGHPVSFSGKAKLSLKKWGEWIAGGFSGLQRHLCEIAEKETSKRKSRLIDSARVFMKHAVGYAGNATTLLSRAVRLVVPIQPVIGNICHRHLRFDGDELCGMIDFKEIGVDSVSWDVASLLGSMAEADPALWVYGLKAYQGIRPLSDHELFLIEAFDRSRIFLEGLDYLEKVFILEKSFSEIRIVEMTRRLDRWNRRFENEKRNRRSA